MATEKDDDVVETEEPDEAPAKKEPAKVTPDDEGGVTVEAEDKPRKSRGERRAERRDQYRQQPQADETAALRRQLGELQHAIATRALQGEGRQEGNGDPYTNEINHIRSEQESIQSALRMGAIQSDTDIERVRKRYYELSEREKRIDRERLKRELVQEMRQSQPEGAHEEAVIRAEYPDVVASPAAIEFARGEYYRLVAKGSPRTLATTKRAMDVAIEEFQLRPGSMPASSTSQQRRYGLPPSQAGQRSNGGGGVRLNSQQMKMAVARWPEADENVAYSNMAKLVGTIDREAHE